MVNYNAYSLAYEVHRYKNPCAANVLRELGKEGYIIAVDFDGTLCMNDWPRVGIPNDLTIALLKIVQQHGIRTILWTCREGMYLEAAKEWLADHKIKFDAYNDNLPEEVAKWNNNPRKVGADEFWDDKNICLIQGIPAKEC